MNIYLLTVKSRQFFLLLLTACCFTPAWNQAIPDSILTQYNSTPALSAKGDYLWNYLQSLSKDSSEVNKALEILSYFKEQKDESGIDNTESFIALRLCYKGDYITALNMGLSILSNCGKRKDTVGILHSFQAIHYSFALAKILKKQSPGKKKQSPLLLQ